MIALCDRFHKMPHELTTDLWRYLQIERMGKAVHEYVAKNPVPASSTGVGMSEQEAWLQQLRETPYTPMAG